MKLKRAIKKQISGAINFASLTDSKAIEIYDKLFNSLREDLSKPKLILLKGGKK